MTYNPYFKVTIIQRQITRKWFRIELQAYFWPVAHFVIFGGGPTKRTGSCPIHE